MKKNYKTDFSTRQYMLSKDFEIYYYSDKHLKNMDSHFHNYYEVYFFLEGNVSIWIRDKAFPLKTGDVVVLPPGVPHRAVIHDEDLPYSRFVFWVSTEYLQRMRQISEDFYYVIQCAAERKQYIYHNEAVPFSAIQSKIFHLIEEINSERFGKESKVFISICDLVLHLNRMAYEQNNPRKRKEEQDLYQKLLMYIDNHLEQDISLEHLAKKFYVSKYYIAHLFKENTGISIHQYIMKKRLAACQNAILSNIGISKAYLMFGFKDYSNFYRAFKKEFGISPKEYKDMNMQIEMKKK